MSPLLNQLTGFTPVHKPILIQTLGSKFANETLNKRVLPGAAGRNVKRLTVLFRQPGLDAPGNKLRAIITTDKALSGLLRRFVLLVFRPADEEIASDSTKAF